MDSLNVMDAKWFQQFAAVDALNDSIWMQEFVKVSKQEKIRFLHDEVNNPRFRCKFDGEVTVALTKLGELSNEILSSEKNEFVRDLYIEKIKKQRLRLAMYENTRQGEDATFFQKSTQIYGRPKKKYFAYCAKKVQEQVKNNVNNAPTKSVRRLEDLVGKISVERVDISADVLPEPIAGRPRITVSEVAGIFDETLKNYGIEGWTIDVDQNSSRTRFSVNTSKKIINVPGEEALSARTIPLTDISTRAYAEHEIGVHVRRSWLGSKQPLQLLQFGLSGYLIGEEGLASYVQQQTEGATEFYGLDRYFAASLAVGMDGEPRDFRSVFLHMYDYYQCNLEETADRAERARNAAWEVCVRIFRGTTGDAVGHIFTRDISYLEGNVQMWDLISDKPHIFEELFIGKYNQFNKIHLNALQSLGILSQW